MVVLPTWRGPDMTCMNRLGWVCAFQQDVGVGAAPEGRLRIVYHNLRIYTV